MGLEKIYSSPFTATFAFKSELNLSAEQIRGVWISLIPGPTRLGRDSASNTRPSLAAGAVVKGLTALYGLIALSTAICSSLLNYG